MAEPSHDPLVRALRALEPPLADDGFSQAVLQQLRPHPPVQPRPSAEPNWLLLLALLTGALVALSALWGLDWMPQLHALLQQPAQSLVALSADKLPLALLCGWSLTLATCGWTLWQFR